MSQVTDQDDYQREQLVEIPSPAVAIVLNRSGFAESHHDEESFRRADDSFELGGQARFAQSAERQKCLAACCMLHLSSISLVIFLFGWASQIDTTEVRQIAPKLYFSTRILQYLLLATVSKDILVQLIVFCQFQSNMQQNGIIHHFMAFFPCFPLQTAVIIFIFVSILANKEVLTMHEPDEPLSQWMRLSMNTLFIAFVYMCVHVFPLSCIYYESQQDLIEYSQEADQSVDKKERAERVIKSLSKFQVCASERPTHQDTESLKVAPKWEQQQQCVICFQDFADGDWVCVLPCDLRHQFHESCLQRWFQRDLTCPVCRETPPHTTA